MYAQLYSCLSTPNQYGKFYASLWRSQTWQATLIIPPWLWQVIRWYVYYEYWRTAYGWGSACSPVILLGSSRSAVNTDCSSPSLQLRFSICYAMDYESEFLPIPPLARNAFSHWGFRRFSTAKAAVSVAHKCRNRDGVQPFVTLQWNSIPFALITKPPSVIALLTSKIILKIEITQSLTRRAHHANSMIPPLLK